MSGTNETNTEIMPREANAKRNFFIRFSSSGQRKADLPHFDAKLATFIAFIRKSLLRDTLLLLWPAMEGCPKPHLNTNKQRLTLQQTPKVGHASNNVAK
jgi:hypothetical protein